MATRACLRKSPYPLSTLYLSAANSICLVKTVEIISITLSTGSISVKNRNRHRKTEEESSINPNPEANYACLRLMEKR
jgi:hypothetical protein